MPFLTHLKVTDFCQTTTNEKLIYFPTNSYKLQKYLGSSKIRSLTYSLLRKIHNLLKDVLMPMDQSVKNIPITSQWTSQSFQAHG